METVMKNSKHLIAPNTGHNVAPRGCTSDLMSQFVNEQSWKNIDDKCLDEIKRPSFFIDGSGPVLSGTVLPVSIKKNQPASVE